MTKKEKASVKKRKIKNLRKILLAPMRINII